MLAVGVTAKAVARFLFHLPNYPFRFATFVILKTLKSLTSGPHIRVKAGQVLSGYLLTFFEERQQVSEISGRAEHRTAMLALADVSGLEQVVPVRES